MKRDQDSTSSNGAMRERRCASSFMLNLLQFSFVYPTTGLDESPKMAVNVPTLFIQLLSQRLSCLQKTVQADLNSVPAFLNPLRWVTSSTNLSVPVTVTVIQKGTCARYVCPMLRSLKRPTYRFFPVIRQIRP